MKEKGFRDFAIYGVCVPRETASNEKRSIFEMNVFFFFLSFFVFPLSRFYTNDAFTNIIRFHRCFDATFRRFGGVDNKLSFKINIVPFLQDFRSIRFRVLFDDTIRFCCIPCRNIRERIL